MGREGRFLYKLPIYRLKRPASIYYSTDCDTSSVSRQVKVSAVRRRRCCGVAMGAAAEPSFPRAQVALGTHRNTLPHHDQTHRGRICTGRCALLAGRPASLLSQPAQPTSQLSSQPAHQKKENNIVMVLRPVPPIRVAVLCLIVCGKQNIKNKTECPSFFLFFSLLVLYSA